VTGRDAGTAPVAARPIVFVGNARCYHTMDWYRTVRALCPGRTILFASDLIESEGHVRLVRDDDVIVPLFNVDRFLLSGQSAFGNLWRNAVKLLAFPLQAAGLRRLRRRLPGAVYHAHTMYYMFVCWLAGIPFIGTPQGSEVLVRPKRSRLYRHFAVRSLRAAQCVTVDSVAMRDEAERISGVRPRIFQNGVEAEALGKARCAGVPRDVVLSLRGMTPLYRIEKVVQARNGSAARPDLTFIYPFWDEPYRALVRRLFQPGDRDLGRLDRREMMDLLSRTGLVLSVPSSDSSPRSVYEAIFAGACVAATRGLWMEVLPACMRARIRIIDLDDPAWFDAALGWSRETCAVPYEPSDEALEMFDQRRSMAAVVRTLYAEPLAPG